jgi:hypothetical protein
VVVLLCLQCSGVTWPVATGGQGTWLLLWTVSEDSTVLRAVALDRNQVLPGVGCWAGLYLDMFRRTTRGVGWCSCEE